MERINFNLKMIPYFLFCIVICGTQLNLAVSEAYRLPKNVKPILYNLTMEPNLKEGLFTGSVVIDLVVLEETKNIIIHNRNLTIHENDVKVIKDDGSEVMVLKGTREAENETYTIFLERELEKGGKYSLAIGNFSGSLLWEDHTGFYSILYEDEKGHRSQLAITAFETANARQAFPCFDEPALRARFLINIIRNKDYSAVSNEVLETTIDLGSGRYQDTFKETVEMPTYLVAFTVSKFQAVRVNQRHTIYARPEAIPHDQFSYVKEVVPQIMQVLEDFTGIDFAMSKLDLFAVPDEQFMPAGMENWGLIIFGESNLFCTNSSSINAIQSCTQVIAHEFAHQWFGNLVAVAWWDYTWLKEGISTYFHHYILSTMRSDWRMMEQFVVEKLYSALSDDSDEKYRDLALNFHYDYHNIFVNYMVYDKGSSIVRMIEHVLTQEVFKKGIRKYLQSRKFGVAEPNDLYQAFQEVVEESGTNYLLGNLTVAEIMKAWTDYPGYPVVNVTRNYETGSITFEQTRFYGKGQSGEDKSIWHVPINYAFQSDNKEKFSKTTADFWLSEKDLTIDDNSITNGWLLVNIQETGFYRVNYDVENWERLANFLSNDDFKVIPAVNRAKLINDAVQLAYNEKLPFKIVLKLLDYLRREKDYIPIGAFLNNQYEIESLFVRSALKENNIQKLSFGNFTVRKNLSNEQTVKKMFNEYIIYLLEGLYDYLGIDEKSSDTPLDKLTRSLIIQLLYNSHSKCETDLLKKYEQFKKDNTTPIHSDWRPYMFCVGMKSKSDIKFLYQLHLQNPEDGLLEEIKLALNCYRGRKETIKNVILEFISPLGEGEGLRD